MTELVLFLVVGGVAIVAAALMLLSENAVYSALWLIVNFACVALLYVMLDAPFLAMTQIAVYAGAIMVLFLFVIMLLDLKEEQRRKLKTFSLSAGVIAVGAVAGLVVKGILDSGIGKDLPVPTAEGAPAPLGKLLFTDFILPFEIVSVLLLVAMVGVILLSKKELK